MVTKGVETYSQPAATGTAKPAAATSRLEIPATLILDFKQHLPQQQNAVARSRSIDAPASIVSLSPEALKAANGPVSKFNHDEFSKPSGNDRPPSQEIIVDNDGNTRMVITFYDPTGRAIMTIPPKDSFSDAITSIISHQNESAEEYQVNEMA